MRSGVPAAIPYEEAAALLYRCHPFREMPRSVPSWGTCWAPELPAPQERGFFTPKGLDPAAQGKRSATLGTGPTKRLTPYKGGVGEEELRRELGTLARRYFSGGLNALEAGG